MPCTHARRAALGPSVVRILALAAFPALVLAVVELPAARTAAAEPWEAPLHHVFPLHRGRIGVEIQRMTPELREHMKAPADRGILITRVAPGSAAERAGLKVGDIVVSVAGEPVREPFDLVRRVGRAAEGELLEIGLVRDGEKRTVSVKPEGAASPWIDPERWGEWIERGMQQGSEQLRDQLQELERRLEELERKFEQNPPPGQPT